MVKVYVELVWDTHFPGKLTMKKEKEKKVRGKIEEGRIAEGVYV